jgi:hypothetical protein
MRGSSAEITEASASTAAITAAAPSAGSSAHSSAIPSPRAVTATRRSAIASTRWDSTVATARRTVGVNSAAGCSPAQATTLSCTA